MISAGPSIFLLPHKNGSECNYGFPPHESHPIQDKGAYITLVWSVLEYCALIWDPYLKKDISRIEKLQHRAARFVMVGGGASKNYGKMLKDLGWTNLTDKRRDLILTLLSKIMKGKVAVPADTVKLTRYNSRTSISTPVQI